MIVKNPNADAVQVDVTMKALRALVEELTAAGVAEYIDPLADKS